MLAEVAIGVCAFCAFFFMGERGGLRLCSHSARLCTMRRASYKLARGLNAWFNTFERKVSHSGNIQVQARIGGNLQDYRAIQLITFCRPWFVRTKETNSSNLRLSTR